MLVRFIVVLAVVLYIVGFGIGWAGASDIDCYQKAGQAVPVSSWRLLWTGLGLMSPVLSATLLGMLVGVGLVIRGDE
jgi:hypothetical protein